MATDFPLTETEEADETDAKGKPKKKRHVSGELAAMADICDLLDDLDGEEQFRVKQWFLSKCRAETEDK